jgi:hypothetical protein
MSKSNANNPQVIAVYVGTVAAAGDVPVCYLPKKFHLLGASLLNNAAIAASDTDYATLTLKSGSTAIASLDTRAANQGAVTQNVAKDFALAAAYDDSGDAAEAVPASTIKLTYAEGGTMTLTGAVVQLYGYFK